MSLFVPSCQFSEKSLFGGRRRDPSHRHGLPRGFPWKLVLYAYLMPLIAYAASAASILALGRFFFDGTLFFLRPCLSPESDRGLISNLPHLPDIDVLACVEPKYARKIGKQGPEAAVRESQIFIGKSRFSGGPVLRALPPNFGCELEVRPKLWG